VTETAAALDRLSAELAASGDVDASALADGLDALLRAAAAGAPGPAGAWTLSRTRADDASVLVARGPGGDELCLGLDAAGRPSWATWDRPREPDAVPLILDVRVVDGVPAARLEKAGVPRLVRLAPGRPAWVAGPKREDGPAEPVDAERSRATVHLPLTALPWALVVRGRGGRGDRCRIEERVRVGRVAGNDLVIADPAVSRQHAVLERTADGFVLTDLGSANGTWVNGRRIERAAVAPRDRIRFATVDVAIEPD
jgi:hypothetical protein